LKILNVNMSIDPVRGGGTAERTVRLAREFARTGASCTVMALDLGLTAAYKTELASQGIEGIYLPCLSRRFYLPAPRLKAIARAVEDADIVHLMGHWTLINALVFGFCLYYRKPYVVCPAGALPIFGRSKRLKQLYNRLVGESILRKAAGWIAITPIEFAHFESYGIASARVTVIPNGVSPEDFPQADTEGFRRAKKLPDAPLILFMGRLNPIKGPDLLLQAFALVQGQIPDYHLVFAGPDEGMQGALREMAEQHGIEHRVHFLGFVGGTDKAAAYRTASLLVVPSRQEAMSIVALEAGINGTAVMLTDQCGFAEIGAIDAGLEVPATASALAKGLSRLLLEPGLLERVASSLQNLVMRQYTWQTMADLYLDLYGKLLQSSAHQ
jgi:glycosyltransferase involved in cell wall biosynthesis